MWSKARLNGIAGELVEKINEDLDLPSIRNLRLTCKTLGDRCCGPRFRSFLEHQKTDLTASSLQRLCRLAHHSRLGSAVLTLTVLATINDASEIGRMLSTKRRRITEQQGMLVCTTELEATQEELDEAHQSHERLVARTQEQQQMTRDESEVRLLADALRSFGLLAILEIEAVVDQGSGNFLASSSAQEWHPVWIRAVEVYRTVMLAIAHSSIAVDTLHVYKGSRRCSVPTWDVGTYLPALEASNFSQAARHIKSISLSVSTKVETNLQKVADARADLTGADRAYFEAGMGTQVDQLSESDPQAIAEGNYPGVARLLTHMPNLEILDLHLYNTLRDGARCYAKVFECIADDVVLQSLRHCTLRGIRCSEPSLLKFFRVHDAISTFEMSEIHLTSGSYSPIFAHLCTLPHLQSVTLHNLWAPRTGLLSLAPKNRPIEHNPSFVGSFTNNQNCSYRCVDGTMVHTRKFSREEIQGERFEFAKGPSGRQMGSPQFMAWMRTRQAEYGPP